MHFLKYTYLAILDKISKFPRICVPLHTQSKDLVLLSHLLHCKSSMLSYSLAIMKEGTQTFHMIEVLVHVLTGSLI
jgi:hypothetical protein